MFFFFFFFQAEDGIRDTSVTGVQTCALPIYPGAAGTQAPQDRPARHGNADAGAVGLAARGAAALPDGADPDTGGGGRQAAEPRAQKLGERPDQPRQPDEVDAGMSRH